jgi:hypothetical protein
VSALKFSIVEQPAPVDTQLAPVMGNFLEALKDKELVRLQLRGLLLFSL